METKEIRHGGKSLYFCSTDGQRWVGVNQPPQNQTDEQIVEAYVNGGQGRTLPMAFDKSFIDSLEGDNPQAQNLKNILADSVVTT